MRAVVQRVTRARVTVDGEIVGEIGNGLVVLLGVAHDDTKQDADYLLRIADNISGGRTICAFGEACSWPVQSFVRKFKDEFEAKGAADEARRQTTGVGPTSEMKLAASPDAK